MTARNPLSKITDAAQGAASLPVKATGRAVGVVAGGVRVAASLFYSTAERAKSMVGIEDEKDAPAPTDSPVDAGPRSPGAEPSESPAPGPVTAPPAVPLESVEELAEAAVAREMAEEPLPTAAPSEEAVLEPTPATEVETVFSTSTAEAEGGADGAAAGDQALGEPLIDEETAKALKRELDSLREAADADKG